MLEKSQIVRTVRTAAPLRDRLGKRLAAYAAAASAAGVGLLAAASPADARIVYTPADRISQTSSVIYLDLNHDGTNDFLFMNEAGLGLGSTTFLIVKGLQAGNAVLELNKAASALAFAARIGSGTNFSRSASMAFAYHASLGGPWANVQNRYLGLEFNINGQRHYGWAEFSVSQEHSGGQTFGIEAKLEGYAFDTVPNQAVYAGERGGAASTRRPATLGLLALGSAGRAFWARRGESG